MPPAPKKPCMRRSSPLDSRPYADLPDEVLQAVLSRTVEVAEGVKNLFAHVDDRREAMRDILLADGRVRRLSDLPQPTQNPSSCAVDGGAAIEKALGADTALAVAVGIEGLTQSPTPHWPGVQYDAWQKTLPHEGDQTSVTCRGVMMALELAVLRDAPHEVVLLDGSHLSPVIALNTLLTVSNEELRQQIAEIVEEKQTADALRAVMEKPEVVAVVKYDSSRDLSQTWLPPSIRGPGLGLDDRTTMSLLLNEGEFSDPQPVGLTQQSKSNWLAKRIEVLTPTDAAREAVRLALNDAITLVRDDCLFATYYKPHGWSPAFRLEIKPDIALNPARLGVVLACIKHQVVSPEIREPYPQWVADRMAKSVGDALVALRTAVNFDLADSGMSEYVSLVAHSYRTESM